MTEFRVGDRVKALNDWFVKAGSGGIVVPQPEDSMSAPGEYVYVDLGVCEDPAFPFRDTEIELVEAVNTDAVDQAYAAGYAAGLKDGEEAGYEIGRNEGFNDGYERGQEAMGW